MIPEISVVILCYKEGQRLSSFVNRTVNLLERLLIPWEIVLVANYWDNKDDDTPKEAKKISAQINNIKVVSILKQGGMGWDARNGFKKASGKFICLIDGDGQMPPEDIIRVYEKIKNDKLDFVTTYRTERGDSILRKVNSYIYNLVFRILFPNIKVKDANSKPKIFTKEAYSKMRLTANDWFLDAEMLIQCARMKLKTGEIPVTFDKCVSRESFVRIDAIFEFIVNLLRARIKEFFTNNE
jgi:glycosyltransferase involved in cell wall biosynthesis